MQAILTEELWHGILKSMLCHILFGLKERKQDERKET